MTKDTRPGTDTSAAVNRIGLPRQAYLGGLSTLCAGCGHNTISSQIIAAAFELSLEPHRVIKLSGIGCSSKTPAYFLNRSHGFNTLHGRMPSVATGAVLANRGLHAIGVSGDGDTASIGIGQFKHMVRRNTPILYIVENNGVYGLTKGQQSATADVGQTLKHAGVNELPPIDVCIEALTAHCGFVARSFAGDARQMRELLKAALRFDGTAVLDVVSPCVTFNNEAESTKSFAYGRQHQERIQDIQFVPAYEEIAVEYDPGTQQLVRLHDGSTIRLTKLGKDYEPTSRWQALARLEQARVNEEFVTGLLYMSEDRPSLPNALQLTETPLAQLADERLRPSPQAFAKVLDGMM